MMMMMMMYTGAVLFIISAIHNVRPGMERVNKPFLDTSTAVDDKKESHNHIHSNKLTISSYLQLTRKCTVIAADTF